MSVIEYWALQKKTLLSGSNGSFLPVTHSLIQSVGVYIVFAAAAATTTPMTSLAGATLYCIVELYRPTRLCFSTEYCSRDCSEQSESTDISSSVYRGRSLATEWGKSVFYFRFLSAGLAAFDCSSLNSTLKSGFYMVSCGSPMATKKHKSKWK